MITAFAAMICTLLSLAGMAAVLAGTLAVRRFVRLPSIPPRETPACTILRPLYGDEPGLNEALETLAAQNYPRFQIVFGVQDPADPALKTVRLFANRHPALDITIIADARLHGANRKISNLMNMLPHARHDLLVFSDSDVHAPPDYLTQIVAALERPGAGLVTTLCVGRPAVPSIASRLAAGHMRHCFLPGALLGEWAGRQDCLGTTMALRRDTLDRAGGLRALADHLADDNILGQLVKNLGLSVALAHVLTIVTISETSFAAVWRHELRWARTIRALIPLTFAGSASQFPLFWAAASCVLMPSQPALLTVVAAAAALRIWAACQIDAALSRRFAVPRQKGLLLLLGLRDCLSVTVVAASFMGRNVVWRGHVLQAEGFSATAERKQFFFEKKNQKTFAT